MDALTVVTDLAVGPGGDVYLAQPQENLIRVFDPGGNFLRTIGGTGGGPGEFQSIWSLGWLADTLWVVDGRHRRVTYFSPSGEVLATTLDAVIPATEAEFLPDLPEGLLRGGYMYGSPVVPARADREAKQQVPLVVLRRNGGEAETVDRYSITTRSLVLHSGADLMVSSFQPFSDAPLIKRVPSGDGFVVIERPAPTDRGRGHFEVTRYSPSGDTIYSRRFSFQPEEVEEAEIDSLVALAAKHGARRIFGTVSAAAAAVREAMFIPRYRPAVSDAVVAEDGSVWLKRTTGAESARWLVLNPSGRLEATVRAPADLRMMGVEDSRIWGTVHDDLAVPYLVGFQIRKQ